MSLMFKLTYVFDKELKGQIDASKYFISDQRLNFFTV